MQELTAPVFKNPSDLCNYFHDDPEGFGDMCMRVMESLGYTHGETELKDGKFYARFQNGVIRCVFHCGNMPYKSQVSAMDIYKAREFFTGASYATYITGSMFQPPATEYIERYHIHPVDGKLLILLLRKANLLDMEGHYKMRVQKKNAGMSVNNMQRMDPRMLMNRPK